eukprot:scaffold8867_cov118-Isochrysis_galbana.AAC.5
MAPAATSWASRSAMARAEPDSSDARSAVFAAPASALASLTSSRSLCSSRAANVPACAAAACVHVEGKEKIL